MKILGVIPARYASTRLEGKPLLPIGDKPMVVHVYHNAQKCPQLDHLLIATDHPKIFQAALDWNCNALMTSPQHPSGTDRILEVIQKLPDYQIIINIQGDEPFLHPSAIEELINVFHHHPQAEIATLIQKIETEEELWANSVVKCVRDHQGRALYFSRSVIPFLRSEPNPKTWHQKHAFWKHIGIYAYTRNALQKIQTLSPSPLEQAESLEQLRWLENGLQIYTAVTHFSSLSVDTPEDYHRALLHWEQIKTSPK